MIDRSLSRSGSEAAARDVIGRFYRGAPAYRRLIDASLQRLGKSGVHDLGWDELPILTKDGFYASNPWREYVPRESYGDIYAIIRSSGATSPDGTSRGFFWPQLRSHDTALAPLLQARLIETFRLGERKTLVIIGLSLGSWAGGEQFSLTFKALALRNGFPLVVFSPGNQHAEILEMIGAIHDEVDHILIALCPSAIFYLEQLAKRTEQILPLEKISFLVTGEPFPEELRLDLARRARHPGAEPTMLSVYGSADTGILGAESFPLIGIRQFLHARPEVAQQLGFASASIPNLYHVQRDETFYEVVDGELVITRWQGIPLARYNLKDRVQLHSWPVLCRALAVADTGKASFWNDLADQPYPDVLSVAGRAQGCLFLCGSNVFESMIEEVFLQSALRDLSTGAYCVWTELDAGRQVLCWQVELKEGRAEPDESEVQHLHEGLVQLLGRQQPEFAADYETFYRPFEPSGLRILRFLFTPSPRLSQWQLKKIKRRIILERGPVA
jgi:phenylacetate-CoA ligase